MSWKLVSVLNQITFWLSWALITLNVSQTEGIFVRPLLFYVRFGTTRYPVGAILIVPLVAALTTLILWWPRRSEPRHRWRIGHPGMTIAVVTLGSWALVRSLPVHSLSVLIPTIVAVVIFWCAYGHIVQTRQADWFLVTLGILALIHGGVAVAQFVRQGSIGLTFLGELRLDPQIRGSSVIEVRGQRWLRAYGLLPHPNVLGGMMGMVLFIGLGALLGEKDERRAGVRWRLWRLGPAESVGIAAVVGVAAVAGIAAVVGMGAVAGLFLSFSRSAWLGTGVGLLYFALTTRLWLRISWRAEWRRYLLTAGAILIVISGTGLGSLAMARLGQASSLLERNSVSERVRDIGQALMLIRHLPLTGVGTGYYLDALWAWAGATEQYFPAFQHVHNVPLLVGAEMGLPGMGLWLCLVTLPVINLAWAARREPLQPARAALGAAFLFVLTVSMLDSWPHLLHFRSAALLGALCGVWAQTTMEASTDET